MANPRDPQRDNIGLASAQVRPQGLPRPPRRVSTTQTAMCHRAHQRVKPRKKDTASATPAVPAPERCRKFLARRTGSVEAALLKCPGPQQNASKKSGERARGRNRRLERRSVSKAKRSLCSSNIHDVAQNQGKDECQACAETGRPARPQSPATLAWRAGPWDKLFMQPSLPPRCIRPPSGRLAWVISEGLPESSSPLRVLWPSGPMCIRPSSAPLGATSPRQSTRMLYWCTVALMLQKLRWDMDFRNARNSGPEESSEWHGEVRLVTPCPRDRCVCVCDHIQGLRPRFASVSFKSAPGLAGRTSVLLLDGTSGELAAFLPGPRWGQSADEGYEAGAPRHSEAMRCRLWGGARGLA